MFLTIGLIIGFVLGWYVNEKFEDIAAGIKTTKILEVILCLDH